jgi:hypothetical protein
MGSPVGYNVPRINNPLGRVERMSVFKRGATDLDVDHMPVDRYMGRSSGNSRIDAEFDQYQAQRRAEETARTGGAHGFTFGKRGKPSPPLKGFSSADPANQPASRATLKSFSFVETINGKPYVIRGFGIT